MPEMPQSEIDALGGFRLIASEYGGSPSSILKKIRDLEEDNRKYRQEEKPALEALIPKPDQAVVPKTEAELLAAYKALGTPDEVKTKIETGEQSTKALSGVQLRESAAKLAKAAGLADEAVDTLIAIPALQGAKFEVRKGKVKDAKGNEVEKDIPYLTLPGENQTAMKFEDAKEKVPALKGLAVAAPPRQDNRGQSFVVQTNGGTEPTKDIFAQIREEQAAKNKPAETVQNGNIPIEKRLGLVSA